MQALELKTTVNVSRHQLHWDLKARQKSSNMFSARPVASATNLIHSWHKGTEETCISSITRILTTCMGLEKMSLYITILTFMGPCITNVFSSATNKMQRYTIYLFLWNALHVSCGSSAHHHELKTVYTASGTLSKLYCYLPWQWGRSKDGWRNRLKHVQHFITEINKLCNVASCWLHLKMCISQLVRCIWKSLITETTPLHASIFT